MKKLIIAIAATAMLCGCKGKVETNSASAPAEEIFFADPTIYAENGKFYLTGTRGGDPQGFVLLESDNLETWTPATADSMILVCEKDTYGTWGFWAPQLLKIGDKNAITYSANEQTVIAYADSLTGLYTQSEIAPIDGSAKNIDSFLFRDDDGKYYLYHVRFNNGNFLWVGEFDTTTGKIVDGTLAPVFVNTQDWEVTDAYPSAPIMEGPTVIKIENKYYLFYSANHFMSPDYAVGYAVADSPLGPWEKNVNNPIIHRNIVGEKGSGHGDVFVDNNGNYRYVYHVHHNDSVATPRRTRIVNLNLEKNPLTDTYDITVDPSSIIIPRR